MAKLKAFRPGMPLPIPALLCAGLLFILSGLPCPARAGLWCRGDLHAHSTYSGGDSSPGALVAEAEALGLDFFALTDHDGSLGGVPTHWSDPGYVSDKVVLLYGMEWTTDSGHANVWAAAPFDYAPLWEAHRSHDPAAAASAMHDQGGLFSINHPERILVCPWQYPATVEADSIEVWNGMYILPSVNRTAMHSFWDNLLRQGRRIPGVGGSDTHYLTEWPSLFYGIGNPTTWVWAEERSAGAILAGIKKGHVSISYSTDAPRLELAADADADGRYETMMGEVAPAEPGAELSMKLSVAAPDNATPDVRGAAKELGPEAIQAPAGGGSRFARINKKSGMADTQGLPLYLACVYKNGAICKAWLVSGTASLPFSAPAKAGDYFRAELMGLPTVPRMITALYGCMIAVTNPVYVGAAMQ